MKFQVFVSWLAAAGLAASATLSHAQSIGIYLDPEGARCSGPVDPNPVATLYVIGHLGGSVSAGASGAQFRIIGLPSTWNSTNVSWQTAIPGALTYGHPFWPHPSGTGVVIGFGGCYGDGVPTDDVGPLLLGTIQLLLAPTPNDVHLQVVPYLLVPPDPPCPFFLTCAGPEQGRFKVCAAGGEAFLNSTGPDCTVAIRETSWSQVKGLYF